MSVPIVESRYASLPPDATQAVTAIRTLRASVDLGISLDHYRNKLQELLPAVRLFQESRDAASFPELRKLLANASDCYVEVRNIWSDSVYSSSHSEKLSANRLLSIARTPLWEVADANVDLAYDLASNDASARSRALERFAEMQQDLRMAPVLQAAKARIATESELPPQQPEPHSPPASGSRPSRAADAATPKFRREVIEVAAFREMAETLRGKELSKDESELVDDILSLTRPREWADRSGDKSWGVVITIWPDSVRISTKKGDGRMWRGRLSPSSAKVVDRIAALAEAIHALNNRFLTAKESE